MKNGLLFTGLISTIFLLITMPIFAQEPDHYWDAGTIMGHRIDTRYIRHYEFPIRVYLQEPSDQAWSDALDEAINQLSEVVDIERTYDASEASITVVALWGDSYLQRCPRNTWGCATIKPERLADRSVRVTGTVTLLWDNPYKTYTILHELIHALGIVGHSPHGGDVMYHNSQYAPAVLSERDKNTIRMLYELPGLQEDVWHREMNY